MADGDTVDTSKLDDAKDRQADAHDAASQADQDVADAAAEVKGDAAEAGAKADAATGSEAKKDD